MTGTHHLSGPGTPGFLGQVARWLTLAGVTIAAAFMLFFSAAFALVLVGVIAIIALIAISVFWIRAKLTGRPFGPKAHMAEIRRQMGMDVQMGQDARQGPRQDPRRTQRSRTGMHGSNGPIIDATETPEGWTVER
ncbi:hypothetical protein ACFFUB_05135 [Algimonas porphyrae]|uniref:Uncharacterized protein n=1 Tax=Algimonas porphyrae TaxID=1128113 RepID=A0ABQ5UY37_9PROT|nr:hypothetical protein [Algimonas porphyrae]GLQ19839.1 hypothetical protein GCM10007854_07940 [Algimonas porphyrae]